MWLRRLPFDGYIWSGIKGNSATGLRQAELLGLRLARRRYACACVWPGCLRSTRARQVGPEHQALGPRDQSSRRRAEALAAADDPGVPRPRGSEDDADLRALRAFDARGRDRPTAPCDAAVVDGPSAHGHSAPAALRRSMVGRRASQFVTSRRAKVMPEQAGLRTFGRRQVQGLRREEVASLAGVSVECYSAWNAAASLR